MNFSVLPQAQSELDDAYEWYESQALGLGERFLAESVHAFGLIQRFPYGVVYAVEGNDVIILAIAHLHRKPGYWAARF
jgi:plasmid stabilization system protein ParE